MAMSASIIAARSSVACAANHRFPHRRGAEASPTYPGSRRYEPDPRGSPDRTYNRSTPRIRGRGRERKCHFRHMTTVRCALAPLLSRGGVAIPGFRRVSGVHGPHSPWSVGSFRRDERVTNLQEPVRPRVAGDADADGGLDTMRAVRACLSNRPNVGRRIGTRADEDAQTGRPQHRDRQRHRDRQDPQAAGPPRPRRASRTPPRASAPAVWRSSPAKGEPDSRRG